MGWIAAIQRVFRQVGELKFSERSRGKNFYEFGGIFSIEGCVFGEVYWGGERQKSTLQLMIKGSGCSMISDWSAVVSEMNLLPKCRITRVDVALDFFDGTLTLEKVWALRKDRRYWTRSKGGRPPKFVPIGDMTEPGPDGRTIYIGTRDSDLYTRVYEKGMQLFSRLGSSSGGRYEYVQLSPDTLPFICGQYIRFESEFKSKTVNLSTRCLNNPDGLLVDAYPFCEEVLKHAQRFERIRKDHIIMNDLNLVLRQIRKQYGPTLRSAVNKLGPDDTLTRIVGMFPSNRLVEGGICAADISKMPRRIEINEFFDEDER